MQLFTLRRLLIDELEEVYIAEQIVKEGLPRMVKGAANEKLRQVFEQEIKTSAGQVERLERIFEMIQASPRGGHGKSMKVLLSEFEDRMGDGGDAPVVDAALIAAARRMQHWGIASYGTAHILAGRLALQKIPDLIKETLDEKQAMDTRLAELAKEIPVKGSDEA